MCAERYRGSETSVFWIYASTADRMRNGSRDVAEQIGLTGWNDPDTDILKLLQQWFQSPESGRWLLIYDNVDDIDLMYPEGGSGLAAYFPQSCHGSVLITTRNRQVGVKFADAKNTLRLAALTTAESIALITAKLGDDDLEFPSRRRLAETLEGIPLALVQACAFIQENESTTVDRYLAMYEASDANKVQLLDQYFEDGTRDSDLKNPIATTWIVTFDYLRSHRPLAADVLCLMSMFEARAIPEALISSTAEGKPPSTIDAERALSTLQAYSLIHSRDVKAEPPDSPVRVYDLHRLVQLTTRNWLAKCARCEFWVAEAMDMLSLKYDELKDADYDTNWRTKSTYLPHALTLLASPQLMLLDDGVSVPSVFNGQILKGDHAAKGHICASCTSNILTEMLSRNRSWVQKLRLTRKAVAITSAVFGPDHIITLDHRWSEARASWRLEESMRSDLAFRSVLAGCIATLGPKHEKTLRTGRFLAETLNDQGTLDEAEQILQGVIQSSSQSYGETHPLTLEAIQSLSTNLVLQGRREEAMAMNSRISNLTNDVTCM